MNKQNYNPDKLYVGAIPLWLPLKSTLKFWECDHLGRYSSQTKQTINTNCRVGIAHHSGNLKATTLTEIKKNPSDKLEKSLASKMLALQHCPSYN